VRFEWDEDKARENLRRHGVSFPNATEAFHDRLGTDELDPDHSLTEERWRRVGRASDGKLVVVAFTYRGGTIRIISARRATKRERHDHENG
jgi:uncharacterized DUF497 family protein